MNNINTVWLNLLEDLLSTGKNVNPRGMNTKEILGYQTKVSMKNPIITIPERNMNYRFMAGEAFWILSGSNRVSQITPYLKNIAKFSDNNITFRGAYGPKVVEQLDYVVESLVKDQHSRQAIMTIWRENPRPSKDIPCTIALQFFIRDDKMHCNATMRSSDAWLGWVYDVFNFSMIAAWILIAIRKQLNDPEFCIELGDLILTAGSQHLYESNFENAKNAFNAHLKKRKYATEINIYRYQDKPDNLLNDLFACANEDFDGCSPFLAQIKKLKGLS